MRKLIVLLFAVLAFFRPEAFAQQPTQGTLPQVVSICDLVKDPKPFDRKQIQIRGRINLEFEDFEIYDSACSEGIGIWLAFGGDVSTPTMSTVNDTNRPNGKNIEIGGVAYTLVKDDNFEEFHRLITATTKKRATYRVTATLTGTFLMGNTKPLNAGGRQVVFPGYGHLGCCYLFIVGQVSGVEYQPMKKSDIDERWRKPQPNNPN